MEELLSGLLEEEPAGVARRAATLLQQLIGLEPEGVEPLPDPQEAARTALSTLCFPEVAAMRPSLLAEANVWAGAEGYLAGRADAVSVADGRVQVVLDWKSDVAPTARERAGYHGQLAEYLSATGAGCGALV
jgi:CRISPR-associated exonuclease Cas4